MSVLHFLGPEDDPAAVVAAFRDVLAPGSHIAISHVAELPDDRTGPARAAATREAAGVYEELAAPFVLRTPEQITGLFAGLQLIDPGVVPVQLWQPTRGRPGPAVPVLGGLGRVSAPVPGAAPDARPAGELSATHPGGLIAGIPVSGNPSGSAPDPDLDARHGLQRLPAPELELRRSTDHGNVPGPPGGPAVSGVPAVGEPAGPVAGLLLAGIGRDGRASERGARRGRGRSAAGRPAGPAAA